MKVINLSNIILFADDIVSIYKENKCGEFHNYTNYYIQTKYKNILVNDSDYKKVQDYLLSLNEPIFMELPKEDKKIEHINKVYDLTDFRKDYPIVAEILKDLSNKQYEIIDKVNGGE